ncbi:MAG TPA: hypothetical protein VFC46_05650, partial [Humisphaera sp.]|nr:hypothetical protein [Humisphaera sp.]
RRLLCKCRRGRRRSRKNPHARRQRAGDIAACGPGNETTYDKNRGKKWRHTDQESPGMDDLFKSKAFIVFMVWNMWPFVGLYGAISAGAILLFAYFIFISEYSD